MSRWYIIHAYSGFENKVRDAIMSEATRMGLTPFVEQIEVPTETVTEVKRGKKVQVERKFMPGYVLAKLAMNDDVYHLVKNTPKVTGFLGSEKKPQPISEREAARYFGGVAAAQALHRVDAALPEHRLAVLQHAPDLLEGPPHALAVTSATAGFHILLQALFLWDFHVLHALQDQLATPPVLDPLHVVPAQRRVGDLEAEVGELDVEQGDVPDHVEVAVKYLIRLSSCFGSRRRHIASRSSHLYGVPLRQP